MPPKGVAAVVGLAVLAPPPQAEAVSGPAQRSFQPVRPGHVSRASISFAVAEGEQIPAALLEGSGRFRIESDRCAGRSRAGTCRVRVRFAPTTIGPQRAALRVGKATVALAAFAYGVGPSLVASPGSLSWASFPRGFPPVDAVRRVRLVNRGDAPVKFIRLAIRGRDRAHFAITAQSCSGRRLVPGAACRIAVRLRSSGGVRRARLKLSTDLPQQPFTLRMGNDFFTVERRILGNARDTGRANPAWSLGVVRASFADGVVTDIYTSLSANVSVTVFRGRRKLPSRTASRRLIGRQAIVVPGALSRGSYRLRVVGRRPGEQRTVWRRLRV